MWRTWLFCLYEIQHRITEIIQLIADYTYT